MDFNEKVKDLRKQYFDAIKQYYDDKSIILKMIFLRGMYFELSESQIEFQTVLLNRFSDKNILKNHAKNKVIEAVTLMRTRGVCCMSLVEIIGTIIKDKNGGGPNAEKALERLKYVQSNLKELADQSFEQANVWARQNNMPQFEYMDPKTIEEKENCRLLNQK